MGRSETRKHSIALSQIIDLLGQDLIEKLSEIYSRMYRSIYLSGGTVRDLILGRVPVDIDLTVPDYARKCASELSRLTGGTYVPLGKEEDAARVVWQGRDIDFSSFREGAETIGNELKKRDITINSLAVPLDCLVREGKRCVPDELEVIDPLGGIEDLENKRIRITSPNAFKSDPLRLLRVFRFASTLGFSVERKTFDQVAQQSDWIRKPAAERVASELDLIMHTDSVHEVFFALAESGLLFKIIPELEAGVGMDQPASHHLDVFDHSLATLHNMVRLQKDPASFFLKDVDLLEKYIAQKRHCLQLRWAAFFHDLGKPATLTIDEDRDGKITFYNHDRRGSEMVEEIGLRLKWSNAKTHVVANLVHWHMRPFHLCNVQHKEELSLKACLRLVRLVGDDLPGLFLLSMADALAGKGEERPEQVEREVASLFSHMVEVQRQHVEPVRSGPPLLTGQDLIDELQLEPGPIFREILEAVEEAHMEKLITKRDQAIDFARSRLKDKNMK